MNPAIRALLLSGARRYVGSGDIVFPWTAWYGLRAYSAAVAATGTQKAVNVRASGDNATTDILILPNGNLDVATAAAFQTAHGGNLFVTKWYDQSGNLRDVSQGTAANQPQLVLSGAGFSIHDVALLFSGSQSLATGAFTNIAQPFAFVSVAKRTAIGSVPRTIGTWNGSTGALQEFDGSGQITMYSGAFITSSGNAENTWYSLASNFNGALSSLVLNAATTLGSAGANSSTTNALTIGSESGGGHNLTGMIAEGGFYPGTVTSAVTLNAKTYYGF